MNFKFTVRNTCLFLTGLIAAGILGAWLDSPPAGLVILIATIYYIANDKPKK